MTQSDFLQNLNRALAKIPTEERQEMLYDYEEHIRVALEKGVSEEEAVQSLGSPRTIAKELLADYYVQQAQEDKSVGNLTRAIIATISLGFFNLIFVSGPFLIVIGVLGAFFGTAFALIFIPIASALGLAVASVFVPFGLGNLLWSSTAIFPVITMEGIGLLFLVATIYLAKWFGELFIAYLKFNLRIIKGGN